MREVPNAVPDGLVDVVAERDVAVGGENDVVEVPEPLAPLLRPKRVSVAGERGTKPLGLGRVEVSFDVADLPVDPVLASRRFEERETAHVRVAPSDSEYFDAAMRAPLLRRISEETGGVYYTPQTVSSLADDVKYTGRGVTTVEERDLWDMPINFVLLIGLAGAEWFLRKRKGLA